MGVDISANKSNRCFHCGGGGFFSLRKNIALAYDKELGEHYANMISALGIGGRMEEYNKKTNEILADGRFKEDDYDILDFLYASDCEGKASHKTCKKIYNLIKDIDFGDKIFTYAAWSDGKDYEYFKEFLLECYRHRRKMRWS